MASGVMPQGGALLHQELWQVWATGLLHLKGCFLSGAPRAPEIFFVLSEKKISRSPSQKNVLGATVLPVNHC